VRDGCAGVAHIPRHMLYIVQAEQGGLQPFPAPGTASDLFAPGHAWVQFMKFKPSYLLGVASTKYGAYKVECRFAADSGKPFVTSLNGCSCLLELDDVPDQVGSWVRMNHCKEV